MTQYNLEHLIQTKEQKVIGPIQDDEALLLFALIKTCLIKNVIEIGGLNGYSANNFLEAVGDNGSVVTIDINLVPKIKDNHIIITKDVSNITISDLNHSYFGLIFLDAHVFIPQVNFIKKLLEFKVIDDRTIIAIHDTNLHPTKNTKSSYKINDGWVHQKVERMIVNTLIKDLNYHAINLHTKAIDHDVIPYRHGLTLLQKAQYLEV